MVIAIHTHHHGFIPSLTSAPARVFSLESWHCLPTPTSQSVTVYRTALCGESLEVWAIGNRLLQDTSTHYSDIPIDIGSLHKVIWRNDVVPSNWEKEWRVSIILSLPRQSCRSSSPYWCFLPRLLSPYTISLHTTPYNSTTQYVTLCYVHAILTSFWVITWYDMLFNRLLYNVYI